MPENKDDNHHNNSNHDNNNSNHDNNNNNNSNHNNNNASSSCICYFSMLPDALWRTILGFCDPASLCQMEAVNQQWNQIDTDSLWNDLCQKRWKKWPMYSQKDWSNVMVMMMDNTNTTTTTRTTNTSMYYSPIASTTTTPLTTSNSTNTSFVSSWKDRYQWVEQDIRRTVLTDDDLQELTWYFNFTPQAAGRGDDTLRTCRFWNGFLILNDFPPLPYQLMSSRTRQILLISNFPPHFIRKRSVEEGGEWVIWNDNVTFVTLNLEGVLAFNERGFFD